MALVSVTPGVAKWTYGFPSIVTIGEISILSVAQSAWETYAPSSVRVRIGAPGTVPFGWIEHSPSTAFPIIVPTARHAWQSFTPDSDARVISQIPIIGHAWSEVIPALSAKVILPPGPMIEAHATGSWQWRIVPDRPRSAIHICTLGDIELPISSWQARLRDQSQTYLSVVTGIDYVDAIMARTDARLKIFKGWRFRDSTGGRFLAEILDTKFHSIRYDRGPRSASVTLVGYATITHDAPKTVALDKIGYISLQADGKRRLRTGVHVMGDIGYQDGADWDFAVRPGDTIIHPYGAPLIVGYVSISVSTQQEIMEMVEL